MLIICILECSECLYRIHWFYGAANTVACIYIHTHIWMGKCEPNCNMSAILMGRRYILCTHKWFICFAYMALLQRASQDIYSKVCAPFNFHPFFCWHQNVLLYASNYCRIENVNEREKNHFNRSRFLSTSTWGKWLIRSRWKDITRKLNLDGWQTQRCSEERKVEWEKRWWRKKASLNEITRARETPIRRDILRADEWTNICLYMKVIDAGKHWMEQKKSTILNWKQRVTV